jgi:Head domain of trimeric autotransporter adhesin
MGVKISGLTAKGATIADTDLVEVSQSAGGGTYVSRSVTGANIKALVTDANLTTTDVTTNNVSTSKHGFAPKAPNDGTKFLDGLGAYDTVKDSDLSLSDITTNDVSTTKHGFAPKAPNDTTKFLRGDGTWAVPAGGGLTKFTEAENTSAPNGTVYVDSLTAAASSTNADFAIVPKGSGALLVAIPDNTNANGNKRGAYAVDLQLNRTVNSRVASGTNAVAIGRENTASGTDSMCLGILGNATGTGSMIVGSGTSSGSSSIAIGTNMNATKAEAASFGNLSTASGVNSMALGHSSGATGDYAYAFGREHTVSGIVASAIGGQACTSSGSRSIVSGHSSVANGDYSFVQGLYAHSFGIFGRQVYANGREGTTGDAQKSLFVLRKRTTGNTATTLTADSGGASSTNQVILQNNNAFRFKGTIIGKKSGTTDIAAWDIDGLIVRGANAAATTLAVSNVTLIQNTPAWGTPTLAADTTNGGLQVQVTGAATTNIQWTATIETTEVIYA